MRATAVVAAAVTAAMLSGCSGLTVGSERSGTVGSAKALELAWSTPSTQPDWLPADATHIRYAITTMGGADRAPAALRAITGRALPASCREARPVTQPAIDASWAPRTPASVMRCGNWFVARTGDGYYGWTPAGPGG